MRAEFVNPFLVSLLHVISTMAQLDLKAGAPRKKNDELARGDVSGLIGMVGPQTRGHSPSPSTNRSPWKSCAAC